MDGAVPPIYLGVDDETIVADDVSVADAVLPKNDAWCNNNVIVYWLFVPPVGMFVIFTEKLAVGAFVLKNILPLL